MPSLDAEVAREDRATVDPVVRALLAEVATAVWGRNLPFRRRWAARHRNLTWEVHNTRRPESFTVSVDFQQFQFTVECRGGPIVTKEVSEAQLRRALAVAHHRGPVVTAGR